MKLRRFLALLSACVSIFSTTTIASCANVSDISNHENSDISSSESVTEDVSLMETFFPTEASDLNMEQFKTTFKNSKFYYDMAVEGYYTGFHSYMPENYAQEYNIGAFEVIDYQGNASYYILHNGEIISKHELGGVLTSFKGFVHFALTDMDSNGKFELIVSYYTDSLQKTEFFVYDSATGFCAEHFGIYDGSFAFFKKDDAGNLGIYMSADNNIENATTKYSDITPNRNPYKFEQTEYHVQAKNYKADISFDEYTINFPLFFKDLRVWFNVKVAMTWLGEPFSYEWGNGYKDGAEVEFFRNDKIFSCEGWFAIGVDTTFYVTKGEVLERSYKFLRNIENEAGMYAMKVNYRFDEEEIVVENVLNIA